VGELVIIGAKLWDKLLDYYN